MAKGSQISDDTKTIITVLLLVFVYPIGVIMMWKWMNWPKWAKWLISIPVIIFIVAILSSTLILTLNPLGVLTH